MATFLYYVSLPVYWIFAIIYPIYQSYKVVEAQDSAEPAAAEESRLEKKKPTNRQLSHWVNFWIISNLFHLLTGLLEHGSPEMMPAFYIMLKMATLIYLSVSETDVSGMILESCITPFFKPLVPEIDSALHDVVTEIRSQTAKLVNMAKTANKKPVPRKPSPVPSSN